MPPSKSLPLTMPGNQVEADQLASTHLAGTHHRAAIIAAPLFSSAVGRCIRSAPPLAPEKAVAESIRYLQCRPEQPHPSTPSESISTGRASNGKAEHFPCGYGSKVRGKG